MRSYIFPILLISLTTIQCSTTRQNKYPVVEDRIDPGLTITSSLAYFEKDSTLVRTLTDLPPLNPLIIDSDSVDTEPIIVEKVAPWYPEIAIRAGLEGDVIISSYVDSTGRVVKSIVRRSDAEIFNDQALHATMHYQFKPATLKGKPISVWVTIPLRFRLARKVQ